MWRKGVGRVRNVDAMIIMDKGLRVRSEEWIEGNRRKRRRRRK